MATKVAVHHQAVSKQQDSSWKEIYQLGAISALLALTLTLLDIMISIMMSGAENVPGTLSVIDWFNLFANDPFRAFRDLGILNIINLIIGIPTIFALYGAHRHKQAAFASLAIILFVLGAAIYISNNTVLAVFALSQEYAAATTEAQRLSLISAGEAMLARGADFTPGSIVGFVLPTIANIMMAFVVLRGMVFSKATAYVGLLGFTGLLIFTVWTTFTAAYFSFAMLIAMIAGIAVMLWNILIARRLFQLANSEK